MSHATHFEARVEDLGLDRFIPEGIDLGELRADDKTLITKLANEQAPKFASQTGYNFHNHRLAAAAQETYTADELADLEALLEEQGTLHIPIADGYEVTVDGEPRPIFFVAATEVSGDGVNHGDMSSMIYLRDHIQTAHAFMTLYLQDPRRYRKEGEMGRKLLTSALHLMSTPAQLQRFEAVINELGPNAGQGDWPHISFHFNDLGSEQPNGWRNKQDTFQMLAHAALEARELGFLQDNDLLDGHKQFLASVVPFLAAVEEQQGYENSGSWEEVAARRTSVLAIETALPHKIKTLSEADDSFDFLRHGYYRAEPRAVSGSFAPTLAAMLHSHLNRLGKRLPFESADYPNDPIKYREADAALAYVLMYGLPELLAETKTPIGVDGKQMSAEAIENLVLEQLRTLDDDLTYGIRRYEGDSYLGLNFLTNEAHCAVKALKEKVRQEARNGAEIDLVQKQRLRNELIPEGREAAWLHPLGQLSAWAANRSLQARKKGNPVAADRYLAQSTHYLNRMLANVTGEGQLHVILDKDGRYFVREVPANKVPECAVTYTAQDETYCTVASPHTALNWGAAMLKLAVGRGLAARQPL